MELRINEIDGKKGAPPRPQRATELQQPPVTTGDLSPRKASASGLEHTDRNANKSNFVPTTPTPNKSKEDKLDPEGDAVMAEHGVKASSKRLALDMRGSKTDGEDTTGGVDDEPPSPSPRIVPSDNNAALKARQISIRVRFLLLMVGTSRKFPLTYTTFHVMRMRESLAKVSSSIDTAVDQSALTKIFIKNKNI